MKIKIPYCKGDKKSDVQLNISSGVMDSPCSEDMEKYLDVFSEYIINAEISYKGNNRQQNYILIKKEEDGLIIEIKDEFVKI